MENIISLFTLLTVAAVARGIDVNNPDSRYTLKNLPGEFSGLHLLSIQYVAFKKIAPEQNIGFDLSVEYQAALKLFQK